MLRTLLGTHLWIEQNARQAFNLDTILLKHFTRIPVKTKIILDVGTGAGPLMLYLSTKTKAKIIGVEIQETRYLQAVKNIKLNHLEHQLSCIHADIKKLVMKDVDLIVTNPPFFKTSDTSHKSVDEDDLIARHEVTLTLEELIQSASRLLKFGGYLSMIHRPDRFEEITEVLQRYDFSIKRIRFVHPYMNRPANHLLIEAMKHGNSGMTVEPPLILYVDQHILTKEMVDIYGGR